MGLLDFLSTPDARLGIGLLAAAGPRADGANAGRRIQEAMQMQDAYGQNQMRSKLLQSQIDENASQAEYRKAQAMQATKKQEMLQGLLGGIGGVSTGGGVNMGGGASNSGLLGMSIDQIALLKANGIDLTDAWKMGKEGFKRSAGDYYESVDGATKYMPKLGEGMGVVNGQVQNAPGYAQANAQTEGMKAGAVSAAQYPYAVGQDAARQNLSAGLDLQPVYNKQTGQMEMRSRAQVIGAAQGMPQAQPIANNPSSYPNPQGPGGSGYSNGGNMGAVQAEQARMVQAEMAKLPPNHPAQESLAKELARLGGGQQQAMPQQMPQSGAYAAGPSLEEQAAAAAAQAGAIKQAQSDVVPKQDRVKALANAEEMLAVIDKAITHPGRETATGMSGLLNPSNYMRGTDAKDFQVVMDQLGGKAFLQAFESLKGGGQITEVEGAKATAAIGRLNTAQSDKAFKEALDDLKGVVVRAKERAMGEKTGGASGGWGKEPTDKPKANLMESLPTANASNKGRVIRDTTTGKLLRSNGIQWKEE